MTASGYMPTREDWEAELKKSAAKDQQIKQLQQRLDVACHVQAGDRVQFDYAVLDELAKLKRDLADENLLRHEIKLSTKRVITLKDVIEELRLMANSMSTQKALAEKIGIEPQYLSDILLGRRKPSPKVLEFLKLERVEVYREVGNA